MISNRESASGSRQLIAAIIRQALQDLAAPQPKSKALIVAWETNRTTARMFLEDPNTTVLLQDLGLNKPSHKVFLQEKLRVN